LVEHTAENRGVAGSNPALAIKTWHPAGVRGLLAVLLLVVVAPASAATPHVTFAGCSAFFAHTVRTTQPRTIVAACGDGNFVFTGLRWSRWSAAGAAATGTAHQNDCTPTCAGGHFHLFSARVWLGRMLTCAHGTRHELTRLSWRFVAAKPKIAPRSGSESFPCH
jgi:hypothetical protein